MSIMNETPDCMDSDDLTMFENENDSGKRDDKNQGVKRKDYDDSEVVENTSAGENESDNFKKVKSLPFGEGSSSSNVTNSTVDETTENPMNSIGDIIDFIQSYEVILDKENNKSSAAPGASTSSGFVSCKRYLPKAFKKPDDIEAGTYVTGATILAMKGVISFEDYNANTFSADIPQDMLEKKFYLLDVHGLVRGMTRCNFFNCSSRIPSVPMLRRLEEEKKESILNGSYISDIEDEDDFNASRAGGNSSCKQNGKKATNSGESSSSRKQKGKGRGASSSGSHADKKKVDRSKSASYFR